jgi:transcriptional/translational regulatory protein YebC/TACO1
LPDKLTETRKKLQDGGFSITSTELFMKPKSLQTISDPSEAKRALNFLESLEEHEDVQKVYANLDIPDAVVSQVSQ